MDERALRDLDDEKVFDGDASEDSECPDGGLKAWLCVLGVSCAVCATFGVVNAWGVFQAYYEQNNLRTKSSSAIAWIGSIQYALTFMPGHPFGRLFDIGYLRLPVAISSAFLIACTILTAECTKYSHFLLCQGIGVGLAGGIVFTAAIGTVSHWFEKKLGLALACVAAGSSVGGTIFPIILKNLLEHQGFQWTLRINGFIIAGLLLVVNLTVSRRLPPKPHSGPFIDLSIFKVPAYPFLCLSLFVGFLGLYTCLTYLTITGQQAGIGNNLSFYLVSIANAGSLLGRLGGGMLADRFGPLNVLIPGTFITGIMTYVWPFSRNKGSLVAVAVLYGISSGVYIALLAQPAARMGKITEVGVRVGMVWTIMSFGALAGPPISGTIRDNTGSFKNVGYFAGSCIMGSVLLMLVTRHLLLHKLVGHA
ncbi:MFS general substrate transporter [Trametes punicea]|nr:MFS general substrate transporter [Trametes punicea]